MGEVIGEHGQDNHSCYLLFFNTLPTLLYHACEICVPYRVIIAFNSPFALLLSPQTSISFRHTAMSATRADDLGDDYLPDGLVADDPDDAVSLESDEDEPEFTGLSADAGPITAASAGTHSAFNTDDAVKAKKRKRREKEKEKRLKVR